MAKKHVFVKVDRVNGRSEDDPAFLRGSVPELGVHMADHPQAFVERAPDRFQSLARVRRRGKRAALTNEHVDPRQHMYLPIQIDI